MGGRNWNNQEVDSLRDMWGTKSIGCIAAHIGRTKEAIIQKAGSMGLGPILLAGDYITLNKLVSTVTGAKTYNFYREKWTALGLPIRRQKRNKCSVFVVNLDDFWKWARQNKHELNFSRFEEDALGKEPAWAKKKRQIDSKAKKRREWTEYEDGLLKSLLDQQSMDYTQIAQVFQRSEAAVKRRAYGLGLYSRPVRRENVPWKQEETDTLVRMRMEGYSFDQIAPFVNHTALAARGKYENLSRGGVKP